MGTWTQRTALTGVDYGTGGNVSVGDVDGDGDVDVVSASGVDQKLYWADSDGAAVPSFTTREITGQSAGIQHPPVGDLDGDGDADLIATEPTGDQIRWIRNGTLHRSAAFGAPVTIDAAADIPSWVSTADLDRDGDQDALLINLGASGAVRWRENTNGAGSFGPANLIFTAFHARSIRVGDLDRDGDLDLVTTATSASPRVAWHENTAGDASSWTTRTISSTYLFPAPADVGDVDRDGDLDVIVGSTEDASDSLDWFENTAGNGSAWTEHAIAATQAFPTDVRLADVDGDGDLDAFYGIAGYATIAWKENTAGDGSAWSNHIIEDGQSTAGPNTVEPVDMDRDGDVDVVVASRGSNNSAWFENANGAGTSWTRHSLGSGAKLFRLRTSDLDLDGDLDVVGSGEETDRLHVFENVSGDGTSWTVSETPEWLDQPFGLDAADLDGDGDDDLLAVGFASNNVISLINGGGQYALPTTSTAYFGMVDGRRNDVLAIDYAHRGRPGDPHARLTQLLLRLTSGAGPPLSPAQANLLFSEIRVFADTGSGAFEPSDTILAAVFPSYPLVGGEMPITFGGGLLLAPGATQRLFVVPGLTPAASWSGTTQFRIEHRMFGSSAFDVADSLPLSLELVSSPVVASGVVQALPVAGDADSDGLLNLAEADTHGSDPLNVDTDGDALEDGDEVNTHGTSPTDDDSDDDGLGDGAELTFYGTLPLDADSENDGRCDGPLSPGGCTAVDNCPAVSNAAQTNSDAYGAGDACQCGNVDGAGGITGADYQLAREAVVKTPSGSFDADFCDVNADAACDVEDLAILQRIVSAQPASLLDACPAYRGQ